MFYSRFMVVAALVAISGRTAVAQSESVRALEEQLSGASGTRRVELLVALADAYLNAKQYDKAERAAEDAERLSQRLDLPEWRAIALNREGRARFDGGKRRAAAAFEHSLKVLRTANVSNAALVVDNLEHLHRIALRAGNEREAAAWAAQLAQVKEGSSSAQWRQELETARRQIEEQEKAFQESREQLLRGSQVLRQRLQEQEAELEQMTQEQMKAAMLLMQQRVLLDSALYRRGLDSLAVVNAHLALREAESTRRFYYLIMAALLVLATGAGLSYARARKHAQILAEKNTLIRQEQQRSEELLLNILPQRVAEELKKLGRTQAHYYPDVAVLFADFVGFSRIAEQLTPQQLVGELDVCFQQFDEIVTRHGLEKIKTIGDAYMCAGGLSDNGGSQLRDTVRAAIEMQQWLTHWNAERDQQGLPRFEARIGIHCGPVVAGVVGSRKFAFDIWGDTVNIAARVEQAGAGGRINISGEVYERIKKDFSCQYRGKVEAKNKGEIDMYFVAN
jgi:class 3 adenylate cyclase